MAEDHRSRGASSRESGEESQYPPPPGEEDDRARPYHLPPPMSSAGVTLPSIHDNQGYGPPPGGRGYPPVDPRSRGGYSASPTNSNGYPPPPTGNVYLPPLSAHPDPRLDPAGYYAYARPPYPDPYAVYGPYRPPPGAPYPYPPDYARLGPPGGPQAQQAAPRQRTSIACRYCRKRKIRCSGYQNTTNGKCTNCDKLRIDCVFQPVSSNAGQAFIPVNAVPGGVPPGTPLYGAYGQPLAPAGGPQAYGPGGGPPPHDYPMAMASPTSSYPPSMDERAGPDADRRRQRAQDDDAGRRLPPPGPYQDEDLRRRSPASNQSSNTPPGSFVQQGSGREVDRTPTPQRNSPSTSGPPTTGASNSNPVMSMGNLVDRGSAGSRGESGRDIDSSMLGRLNRRN